MSQPEITFILMKPHDWCWLPHFSRYSTGQWQFKWWFIYLHRVETL